MGSQAKWTVRSNRQSGQIDVKNLRLKNDYNLKQDGPSLESSSYLNVTLRYLGPWDPWTLGLLDLETIGPWNS